MKTIKLIIGSVSILIFGIGILVSVANGVVFDDIQIGAETISVSSIMVIIFNVMLTIAGILSIVVRRKRFGDIAVGAFYMLAALIGLVASVAYREIVIWAVPISVWFVVAAIFGCVFILGNTKLCYKINPNK